MQIPVVQAQIVQQWLEREQLAPHTELDFLSNSVLLSGVPIHNQGQLLA